MEIKKNSKNVVKDFVIRLANEVISSSSGITEFLVLSIINKHIPIIVCNELDEILFICDKGSLLSRPSSKVVSSYNRHLCINVKFEFIGTSTSPDIISIIYYK